ncbi:MAG: glutamate/tyrosine decarboxylase-like PLP-dependent enzyme [Vicingaceae bacterium]|jgi:glutamate/tyrosine decarboxylase-like PLP-dependent enzyme
MNQKDLEQFQEIVQLILKEEKDHPVAKPVTVDELSEAVDLTLNDDPISDEAFYDSFRTLVKKTPKTASGSFFNQLVGGRRSRALLGDLVASVLNNSMYTYKVAGPMVGVEKEIIGAVSKMVGYSSNSGGTIASGGSMSNFMAMVLGRDAKSSAIQEGVQHKMILYTSEASHYSISKNASLMGIGRKQVRNISTNESGQMNMSLLEATIETDIEEGNIPFFVNVTSGTTVLGAFDSITEASKICKKHQLWLHVDGAYCGAVIFSKKYKRYLEGVELSDSFSLSAHKMLGTPLTCSIFVTQNKQQLYESFSSDASYLFQSEKDDYNPGKSSFQCGRRNDALKLWTLWKSIGTKGLEKLVDHQFELAEIARNYIRSNKDYTLYSFDDSISICFNYKDIPAKMLSKELYMHSKLMVSHGNFGDQHFIRLVTINSDNSEKEIINFFKTIEQFVAENTLILQH